MASEYPAAVIEFAGVDYPARSEDLDDRTRAVRDPAVVRVRVRTMGGRFDAVLFSYSLSMIPGWRHAVDRARLQLAPGGVIAVVDFWDQRDLPGWFRQLLGQWLALFAVKPDRRLVPFFECLAASEDADLSLRPVFGRYALMLTYRAA